MKNNNTSHSTSEMHFADKVEKLINDPKSLPAVLSVILVISLIMMSQWGNPLG